MGRSVSAWTSEYHRLKFKPQFFYLLAMWKCENSLCCPHWPVGSNYTQLKVMAPHSCLENPMDRGAWWAAVHGVAKSRTRLRDFPFIFHFHALEKAMATHSSVLARRIPGIGKPGGLPSMGSHRVGHDWNNLATVITLIRSHIWNVSHQVSI